MPAALALSKSEKCLKGGLKELGRTLRGRCGGGGVPLPEPDDASESDSPLRRIRLSLPTPEEEKKPDEEEDGLCSCASGLQKPMFRLQRRWYGDGRRTRCRRTLTTSTERMVVASMSLERTSPLEPKDDELD